MQMLSTVVLSGDNRSLHG